MSRFAAAPFSGAVKLASAVSTAALAATSVILARVLPHGAAAPLPDSLLALLALVPACLLAGAILWTVRGYELQPGRLLVRRLLWDTRVDLGALESIARDAQAMRGSIRVMGNGGLFAISGRYRNAALGRYRAFVTDPAKAVVLRGRSSGVIVVSPADPEAFVASARPVSNS
jgi:hypothetical protein